MSDPTDWSWLGVPLAILAFCLGVGSCAYLDQAGAARQDEAKAALIAAEKCGGRP